MAAVCCPLLPAGGVCFCPNLFRFPFQAFFLWHRLPHRVRSRQPASEELKISSFRICLEKFILKPFGRRIGAGGGEGGKCCCGTFSPEAQLISQALGEICAVCKGCSVCVEPWEMSAGASRHGCTLSHGWDEE